MTMPPHIFALLTLIASIVGCSSARRVTVVRYEDRAAVLARSDVVLEGRMTGLATRSGVSLIDGIKHLGLTPAHPSWTKTAMTVQVRQVVKGNYSGNTFHLENVAMPRSPTYWVLRQPPPGLTTLPANFLADVLVCYRRRPMDRYADLTLVRLPSLPSPSATAPASRPAAISAAHPKNANP